MISLYQKRLPALENMKDFLTMLLYFSFIFFSNNTIGVYFMVGLILLIYGLHTVSHKLSFTLSFSIYHKYMLLISLFCFVSALWARNSGLAIEKGFTILELLIAFSLLYECYKGKDIDRLLTIVMWAGFILSIYTFFFYGLDNLEDTVDEGGRLENRFANVNVVAMACSSSIIIAYYLFKKRKNVLDILMCIPCLLVVASAGSRKAFVMLIVGVVALFVFDPKRKQEGSNKLLTLLGSLVVFSIVLYFIVRSGIFSGTMERMDGLFASLTGKGEVDSSSMIRSYYRLIGFRQFLETPILGIGMGNGVLLALQHTGRNCYLHCNYAEIAACGGMVGLYVVYWIYVKLIKKELKYVKVDSTALIILTFLFLNLVMDYGAVTYYGKETYFMFMIFCLHYEELRHRESTSKNIIE